LRVRVDAARQDAESLPEVQIVQMAGAEEGVEMSELVKYEAAKFALAEAVRKLQKLYDTQHGYDFFLAPQTQTVQKVLKSCGYVW